MMTYYCVQTYDRYSEIISNRFAHIWPGSDIKITRQNATYDRLELSYLVSIGLMVILKILGSANPNHNTDPNPNYNPNPKP